MQRIGAIHKATMHKEDLCLNSLSEFNAMKINHIREHATGSHYGNRMSAIRYAYWTL